VHLFQVNFLVILTSTETELARITRMPTDTFEQISQAAAKCHKMVMSNNSFLYRKIVFETLHLFACGFFPRGKSEFLYLCGLVSA
jgi:hypothetical protein